MRLYVPSVRTALYMGIEVVGIRRGWHGLISGDMYRMTAVDVSHIINEVVQCCIQPVVMNSVLRKDVRKHTITVSCSDWIEIVAIGGDGTFAGALALSTEYPIICQLAYRVQLIMISDAATIV